ncbi:MAG: response regulator transcription factor [Proteobacteria bacterium]|nr:response regulator transcription factor [Pseudomonadota bacterium]
MSILIIEDHRNLAGNIGDFLESKGHIPDFAMDGIGGLHLALTQEYDVIILDLTIPGMDGLSLCRKLRQEADQQVPVLMLTARDTLSDKLLGFESGADDYLVKPFALEELMARINALAKRSLSSQQSQLTIGDLELDLGTMVVRRAGIVIELNRICLQILTLLMKISPNLMSKSQLEMALWGDQPPGSDVLRSHVYTLRNKIDKPFSQSLLHTVRGIGYKLADESTLEK